MDIKDILLTKHCLRFNKQGKLRILMISDLQETCDGERTLHDMDRLIEKARPDVVVLGGDNCDSAVIRTPVQVKQYLDMFTAPMEKRGIPWMHIFGNHDHDIPIPGAQLTAVYEGYPHCISRHTQGIHGTTNYCIPVLHGGSDEIAFVLWALDSNNRLDEGSDMPFDGSLPYYNGAGSAACWDIVRFDQLMWYWDTSQALHNYSRHANNGMLFMHVAPHELAFAIQNPQKTGLSGNTSEHISAGMFNSGLFATLLQRNEVRCIACGHTHNDTAECTLCGIKMCLDGSGGYRPYGTDSLRGGRLFVLDENDTSVINTQMLFYKDI